MSLSCEKQRYLNEISISNSRFSKKKKKKKEKKKKKKKRSRFNDLGSDEYSYSIFYSDPRISEYSDTRSSPNGVGL